MADKKVEENWNTFWKELLTRPGYGPSLDLIKNELYDYYQMMNEVTTVYMEITDGTISKPNTRSDVVISQYDHCVNAIVDEAIELAVEDALEAERNKQSAAIFVEEDDSADDIPF